jgi:hypothetical protein
MKIYLAAIEQAQCVPIVQKDLIPNAFYSYYYMRKSKPMVANMVANRPHHKLIFVDSGAHSFFAENHDKGLSVSNLKKKTKTKETPDEYMKNYIIWLKKHIDDLDYYAELDIGEIVGQDKVMLWRQQLKDEGLYHKCVTVYHPDIMTDQDYIDMLDDSVSRYVALEGDRDSRPRINYNKYLKLAFERGVKTHGFAMTKTDVFLNYGFWSVDSSSWKAGVIYGYIGHFLDGRVKMLECRNKKDIGLANTVEFEKLFNEDKKIENNYRLEYSARGYLEMAKFLTEVWKERGFNLK